MSRILSIWLIGLYGLTLSQAYMPHVNYWMNRDFIASELCENKDRPELHCEGKCQLKKDIQQTENAQNEGQETSSRLMVEFFQTASDFALLQVYVSEKQQFPTFMEMVVSGHLSSIFHPPRG